MEIYGDIGEIIGRRHYARGGGHAQRRSGLTLTLYPYPYPYPYP
jgi:hypothetical protein